MAFYGWSQEFLDKYAAKVANLEKKLTNEQLEYLRQYYTMNVSAGLTEIEEIAKQWNMDDFDFCHELVDWFFGRRMVEQQAALCRYHAIKAAA